MRTLCSAVLAFEAVVVLLAVVPALALVTEHHAAIVWGGAGVAALCLLAAALLRSRWGYLLGSVAQVAVTAWGFVLPAMFFLGAVFAVLWATAVMLGRRADGYASRRPPVGDNSGSTS